MKPHANWGCSNPATRPHHPNRCLLGHQDRCVAIGRSGVMGMALQGRAGVIGMALAAATLVFGGCARIAEHWGIEPWNIEQHGSIKDNPAPERPASAVKSRRATNVAAPRGPVTTKPAEPQIAIDSGPPAPVAAPGPSGQHGPRPIAPATPAAGGPAPGPTTAPGIAPSVEQPDLLATEKLLEEGRALFAVGQVVEARKRFISALNGPIPEALLALARSFDTFYLSQLPVTDGAPDMQRSQTLYERAVERGAPEATVDLQRIRATLAKSKQ